MGTDSPAGSDSTGFDLSTINRNDLGVMIAGIVVFVASFLPYVKGSVKFVGVPGFNVPPGSSASGSSTAWHSYAILGLILLFLAALVIAAKTFAASSLPEIPLGVHAIAVALAGLGALLVLLRAIFYIDSTTTLGVKASISISWGGYVLIVAAIAETVFVFLGMRESGETPTFGQGATGAGSAPGSPPAAPPPPPPPPTG